MKMPPASQSMLDNLGRALFLLRELRSLSRATVASRAGISKRRLTDYENGKEIPKLVSLASVLEVLDVSFFEFFYTLLVVDQRSKTLGTAPLPWPAIIAKGASSLDPETIAAFQQVLGDVFGLFQRVLLEALGAPRLEEAAGLGRDPLDAGQDTHSEADD
jgi:transcriptional regulator with XRE-family HTH domain